MPAHIGARRVMNLGAFSPGAGGGGTPVDPIVLDLNYETGVHKWNGTTYASEAALLAAIGGSVVSGQRRIIGPFVDPAAPELVPLPESGRYEVDSATSGSPGLTGTATNGEYQMTAAQAVDQPWGGFRFPTQEGKGYVVKAKIRKDASANVNARFGVTANPKVSNGIIRNSGLVGSTTYGADQVLHMAAMPGYDTPLVGLNGNSSGFTGTLAIKDISAKEEKPFAGWPDVQASIVFEGVTGPAIPTVDQVMAQPEAFADSTERNYVKLVWDTNGKLVARVMTHVNLGTPGTLQAAPDLGAYPPNTAFKVEVFAAPGYVGAKLNDNAVVSASVSKFPGLTALRIGCSSVATTNDWAGTIKRIQVRRSPTFAVLSAYVAGDSYGAQFTGPFGAASGAAIQSATQGGAWPEFIVNKAKGNPPKTSDIKLWWDGAPNGPDPQVTPPASEWLGWFDQFLTLAGGASKVIAMPPLKRSAADVSAGIIDGIRAGMISRLGANFIDAQAILAQYGNGSSADNAAIAGGYCPPSLLSDGVHLTTVAMGYVVAGAAARWSAIK